MTKPARKSASTQPQVQPGNAPEPVVEGQLLTAVGAPPRIRVKVGYNANIARFHQGEVSFEYERDVAPGEDPMKALCKEREEIDAQLVGIVKEMMDRPWPPE